MNTISFIDQGIGAQITLDFFNYRIEFHPLHKFNAFLDVVGGKEHAWIKQGLVIDDVTYKYKTWHDISDKEGVLNKYFKNIIEKSSNF